MKILAGWVFISMVAAAGCGGTGAPAGGNPTVSLTPAAPPAAMPPAGTYTWTQQVTLSDATPGATIYYTTDGSQPGPASAVYDGTPITVAGNVTLMAMAAAGGFAPSPAASLQYQITPVTATPEFNPPPGTYAAGQSVALSDATPGATIYYTTDGSLPTTASAVYSSPIAAGNNTVIQALGAVPGNQASPVAAGTYYVAAGAGPMVSAWMTSDGPPPGLQPQPGTSFTAGAAGGNLPAILIDDTQAYQTIAGFGAAFTDSACYLLNEVATPAARVVVNDLFSRAGNGIGLNFMRNPIGASDIARSEYSFDDNGGQPDPQLTHFSIAHDEADILPLVLEARRLDPSLQLMANPWSPPGWMKTSGAMIGGSLLPAMDAPFASYLVRYLEAYAAAGAPVQFLSLQNEPLYVPTNYPGMSIDAATQAQLLANNVLPALAAAQLPTRVLVYDHNWDQPGYPETVFSTPALATSPQIAGIAWHGYGGTPGAMTLLHHQFPAMGNYETEHSGGLWNSDQAQADFPEIIQVLRNWGQAYVKWSLALDENDGPHDGGCGDCTPLVTVNSQTGAVTRDIEFYTLGQFSRFILPGATRVYSSNAPGLVSAAFLNPDATRALIVYNTTAAAITFQTQWDGQQFSYSLPGHAGITFTWTGPASSGASAAYTVPATNEIMASSYNASSGVETENTADVNGGFDIGYTGAGSYLEFRNVDFGAGVSGVSARLACDASQGSCGGSLNFHLDSLTGPLVATLTIPATGGWESWQTVSGAASGASGVHDVYAVFQAPAGATGGLGNLNWIEFN